MLHVTSDFPRSAFIPPRFAYIVRSIWSLSNGKGLSIPYGYVGVTRFSGRLSS